MHFHSLHPNVSSINYHLHYSLVLTLTPTTNSSQTELRQSVIFQPVLQAYPTRHSWIITAHVSLRNLEHHWKLFTRQLTRTQQFLRSLNQHPSAPTQLLTTLQLQLSNMQDIYKSSETTITSAIQLLNSNQLQTQVRCRRELTPLSWRCSQLAYRNCHHEGHPQHQNQNKPARCQTDITMQHPGPCCVNIECHQICHTSQQT